MMAATGLLPRCLQDDHQSPAAGREDAAHLAHGSGSVRNKLQTVLAEHPIKRASREGQGNGLGKNNAKIAYAQSSN
jgi:hypothetical protein